MSTFEIIMAIINVAAIITVPIAAVPLHPAISNPKQCRNLTSQFLHFLGTNQNPC